MLLCEPVSGRGKETMIILNALRTIWKPSSINKSWWIQMWSKCDPNVKEDFCWSSYSHHFQANSSKESSSEHAQWERRERGSLVR